ncbi:hypothetical protein M422DRAFT_775096, partial [Sphaerobolus stellatus SS14]
MTQRNIAPSYASPATALCAQLCLSFLGHLLISYQYSSRCPEHYRFQTSYKSF